MAQTTTNGRASRESAEAAVADAQAQPNADASAPTDAQPQPDAQPRASRRERAQGAQAQAQERTHAHVLAQGCEWHVVPGLGKSGITVEADARTGQVREYLTWIPQIGRVHRVPTYGMFPILDAGDLD